MAHTALCGLIEKGKKTARMDICRLQGYDVLPSVAHKMENYVQ